MDINNEPKSHFAMYLEAMEEMGVKTTTIDKFISTVRYYIICFTNLVEYEENSVQSVNF